MSKEPVTILRGHDTPVTSVLFVNDGEHRHLLTGDESGKLFLWDLQTEEAICVQPPTKSAVLSISQRDDTLYIHHKSGALYTTPVDHIAPHLFLPVPTPPSASLCHFSLHGSHGVLYPHNDTSQVLLFDARTAISTIFTRDVSHGMLTALHTSSDSAFISAYEDGSVAHWDTRQPRAPVSAVRIVEDPLFCLAVAPRGAVALAAGASRDIIGVEITGEVRVLRRRRLVKQGVSQLAWREDGKAIASAGWDKCVRLWSGKRTKSSLLTPLGTLRWHAGTVRCVAFSNDCSLLASGAEDKTVALWRV